MTRVDLERMGNFIWPLVDGERNLIDIGALVREKFGEAAEPLYERLAEYFRTLERNGFIVWKEEPTEEIES
ncbi:MAG: PqqD family protein [Lachnospiraceae bacterium]|nr:PqqD family protein [Lachnospiraceae bacterium]